VTKLEKLNGKATNKWEQLGAREKGETISWSWSDAEDLKAAVVSATEDGAALLLSKTSDGGALVVQVWSGSGRYKLYPATMAELTEGLDLISRIGIA
jgi:hypothetical protein